MPDLNCNLELSDLLQDTWMAQGLDKYVCSLLLGNMRAGPSQGGVQLMSQSAFDLCNRLFCFWLLACTDDHRNAIALFSYFHSDVRGSVHVHTRMWCTTQPGYIGPSQVHKGVH